MRYELDTVSATDAVDAFMRVVNNRLLGRKCHSIISVNIAPPP